MWRGGWNGADWALMGLGMLIFWALVVVGVVWLVRTLRVPGGGTQDQAWPGRGGTSSNARAILDERFARGELTEEEYRQGRDLLTTR